MLSLNRRPGGLLLLPLFLLILLPPVRPPALIATAAAPGAQLLSADADGVRLRIDLPLPEFAETAVAGVAYRHPTLPGYGAIGLPGLPDLPRRVFSVAVPPGAVPQLRVTADAPQRLPGAPPLPAPTHTLLAYDSQDPQATPQFAVHRRPMEESATHDTHGAPVARSADGFAAGSALYPAQPVALGALEQLRDLRVVELIVTPLQVDRADGALLAHRHLEIELRFDYPHGRPTPGPARPESAVWDALLAERILNYAAAQSWRTPPPDRVAPAASPCLATHAWRIAVGESGVYRVRPADLAGLPGPAPIANLRVCSGADEIAAHTVDADGDGLFNGNDRLIFYGRSLKTHETAVNIYWLTVGDAPGLRMAALPAAPDGGAPAAQYAHPIRLESDRLYYPEFPLNDPDDLYDHWFWERIGHGSLVNAALEMPFSVADKAAGALTVTAQVWGFREAQPHRFRLELNGAPLTPEWTFSGSAEAGPQTVTATADAALLHNGTNTLTVRALPADGPGGAHLILVDWATLAYPRRFVAADGRLAFAQPTADTRRYAVSGLTADALVLDVTDPQRPRRLTGVVNGAFAPPLPAVFPAHYVVANPSAALAPLSVVKDAPSDLRNPAQAADYLIVTDPTLLPALGPLIALRQSQGLTVRAVAVQDVFDEFNYGVRDQAAIRAFLYYAYANWRGPDAASPVAPPSYVLLAGDASHDPRDVLGNNLGGDLVPVYLRSGVDPFLGEAAADNQYVALGLYPAPGRLPFMLLGRLPARSPAEMQTLVAKLLAYEAQSNPSWALTHFLTADNARQDTRQTGCAPDPAGNFFNIVDQIVAGHLAPYGQRDQRLYYARCHESDAPQPPYYSFDAAVDFPTRFIAQVRRGAAVIAYTGHAGVVFWGDERFVTPEITPLLRNGTALPILLSMTCLEGQYHRFDLRYNNVPTPNSLSEGWIKQPDGGAVAGFVPTGLSVATAHDYLIDGFYDALYAGGATTLGAAVFAAKHNLTTTAAHQYLHDTFMLLGDPALRLPFWRPVAETRLPILLQP